MKFFKALSFDRSLGIVCLIVLISTGLNGCGEDITPDELFRETLTTMETAVEKKDLSQFMEYISPQYQDSKSRNRDDIKNIARLHILRNRELHIYKHITQIDITNDQYAEAVILVAMAGQPIESAQSLIGLRADLMRFKVSFEFDQVWRVQSAQWSRAGAEDFLQ